MSNLSRQAVLKRHKCWEDRMESIHLQKVQYNARNGINGTVAEAT